MRLPVGLHPRSHGENVIDDGEARTGGGSSPLTRGKTRCTPRPRRLCPAHPRSRGENCSARSATICLSGSSPLTRGKLRRGIRRFKKERLIPAHAGKTRVARGVRRAIAAHPRSRGENYKSATLTRSSSGSSPLTPGKLVRFAPGKVHQGSSPLTRGKLSSGHDGSFQRGLIPAHAGKTGIHRRRYRWRRAHPRSRGENAA